MVRPKRHRRAKGISASSLTIAELQILRRDIWSGLVGSVTRTSLAISELDACTFGNSDQFHYETKTVFWSDLRANKNTFNVPLNAETAVNQIVTVGIHCPNKNDPTACLPSAQEPFGKILSHRSCAEVYGFAGRSTTAGRKTRETRRAACLRRSPTLLPTASSGVASRGVHFCGRPVSLRISA